MPVLYVMRHGEAQPYATTDADRALTPRGKAQARTAAQWLIDVPLDSIWTSSYLRAQQTSQLVAQRLGGSLTPRIQQGMTPDDSPDPLLQALAVEVTDKNLLIVSHLPLVGLLTSLLLHGHLQNAPGFYTASMAAISFDECGKGLGQLLWLQHCV